MSSLNKELKRICKTLDKGSCLFVTYEGEQVIPEVDEAAPGGLWITLDRQWRPEGEPLPEGIEVIPGYVRPQNWKQLQDASDQMPGGIGVDGQIWRVR